MSDENLRPASLASVAGSTLRDNSRKRVDALRGMVSSGAQTINIDNFTTLPIEKLKSFNNHPFEVRNDDEMNELVESIKVQGVLDPIIVRPFEDGEYEILSGHRRTRACQLAGISEVPSKILNVDDDNAIIIMTVSNLTSRKKILLSEKAKAYKMQLDAYKHQGKRNDLIEELQEILNNGDSGKIIAESNSENKRNIARYIRLTYLIPDLLELVDIEDIAFRAAVELSFLNEREQNLIAESIASGVIKKITLQNAEELKNLSKDNQINETVIKHIFNPLESSEQKNNNNYEVFQSATKRALKHFKKTDYQGVQINPDELEQILVDAIKDYADKKIEQL